MNQTRILDRRQWGVGGAALLLSLPSCGSRSGLDGAPIGDIAGGTSSHGVASIVGSSGSVDAGTASQGGTPFSTSRVTGSGGVSTGGQPSIIQLSSGKNSTWRNGGPTFCASQSPAEFIPLSAADVWSDSRGVYVQYTRDTTAMFFNDGNGWQTLQLDPSGKSYSGLTGFVDGPLVLNSSCGIVFIDHGILTCTSAQYATVFTVEPSLAYGHIHGTILKYDGAFWTQFGATLGSSLDSMIMALWASTDWVLVSTYSGRTLVYSSTDPAHPVLQVGLPEQIPGSAWGFGSNDLWVTYGDKMYHFDGKTWSLVWTIADSCNAVRRLWGYNGTVYFIADSLFGRLRDGAVDIIQSYPCGGNVRLQSMWGNSDTEVFLTYTDQTLSNSKCGTARVLWYNGTTLTPL